MLSSFNNLLEYRYFTGVKGGLKNEIFANVEKIKKFLKKLLTKVESYCKLRKLVQENSEYKYGGIAQLARARGSYPRCRWFKSSSRYFEKGLYKPFFYFFKEQTNTGKLIIAKVTVVAARRVSGESSSVK